MNTAFVLGAGYTVPRYPGTGKYHTGTYSCRRIYCESTEEAIPVRAFRYITRSRYSSIARYRHYCYCSVYLVSKLVSYL